MTRHIVGSVAAGLALSIALASCAQSTQKAAVETTAPPQASAPQTPISASFTPDAELFVCPRMTVQNQPPTDATGKLVTYQPFVEPAPGVQIALAPTKGSCFASGFGPRGESGKLHKGIDLHSRPASMIVAAADGVVAEALYRDDYGYMVLIDHGGGVYTRYAHLANIEGLVTEGSTIDFGAPVGLMGDTSAYNVALHLHYEILTGDLDNPKGSFGLAPVDPFALL